jgi:acetylornithine/N-succinyldiaminopimelate aminotransferase
MGKGMGGGLPVGAFTASTEMMDSLMDNPNLVISPPLGEIL